MCAPPTHLRDDGGVGVQVGEARQRVVPRQRAKPVEELCRAVRQAALGQLLRRRRRHKPTLSQPCQRKGLLRSATKKCS